MHAIFHLKCALQNLVSLQYRLNFHSCIDYEEYNEIDIKSRIFNFHEKLDKDIRRFWCDYI